jgi:hypothetical protein
MREAKPHTTKKKLLHLMHAYKKGIKCAALLNKDLFFYFSVKYHSELAQLMVFTGPIIQV